MKFEGIDSREIKCSCDNPNCAEGGISFDENFLRFHFLEYKSIFGKKILVQTTKAMTLTKETRNQLIAELKALKL